VRKSSLPVIFNGIALKIYLNHMSMLRMSRSVLEKTNKDKRGVKKSWSKTSILDKKVNLGMRIKML